MQAIFLTPWSVNWMTLIFKLAVLIGVAKFGASAARHSHQILVLDSGLLRNLIPIFYEVAPD